MKTRRSSSVLRAAIVFGFLLVGLGARSKAADPCDVSVLPREIQSKLEKNYSDWQPERHVNLSENARQFWLETRPSDCPGIAIGNFESKTQLSYALLLVSKPDRKRPGLRIVAFSRTAASSPFVSHVISRYDTGTFSERSDQVISKVPPGQYSEEDSADSRKVSIHLDGLLYEAIGQTTSLYYWQGDRYKRLRFSE